MSAKPTAGSARTHEQGFTDLFNEYNAALRYFAEGLLKDRTQAKDAVATVFESLWNNGNWQALQVPSSYLYKAVYHTCLNITTSNKARQKRQKTASIQQPADIDEAVLERIYRAEVYRELHSALQKLPEQCRRAMQLSYLDGLTVEETARIMEISASAVKTHRMRGVKQLRKLLSDQVFSLFFFL